MGCEREQKQPSEHWQTLGWSRKSTGTQKQHTPPESAYRLGLDSNSAAWVFRQLWRKNCCRLSAAKRRFCLSSADLRLVTHSRACAIAGCWPNADSRTLTAVSL